MARTTLSFENVSKRFVLRKRGLASFLPWRLNGGDDRDILWALRDVSFAVPAGEGLGIIGPNGAGKSTALKLLAGIMRPDGGRIHVAGRLSALIEVGAGFHPELTGRENVYLNGTILGMSRRDIRARFDEIVAFAGVERFIDVPVKRYSSGMYARLGFSIASHVQPAVLLVDEVLSVGDAVFRLRCHEKMRSLIEGGTSLIFVTHNLEQMKSICRNAAVLSEGRVVFRGPSGDAVRHYLDAMSKAFLDRPTDLNHESTSRQRVRVVDVQFMDGIGLPVVWANARDALTVYVTLALEEPLDHAIVELNMRATTADNLLSFNSGRSGTPMRLSKGENRIVLQLPSLPVSAGQYFWNVRVWDANSGVSEVCTPLKYPLVISDDNASTGLMSLEHTWSLHPARDELEKRQQPVLQES